MTQRTSLLATITFVAACGGANAEPSPRPEAGSADVAPPPPPAASTEPATPTAAAYQAVPAAFKLDGSLGEWKAGPSENHVIVALSPTQLVLAGAVPTAPSQGVWIVLSGPSGEVPHIGMWQRGGGVLEVNCEGGYPFSAEPFTEEQRSACEADKSTHHAFVAGFEAQFERAYHITDKGVFVMGADGKGTVALPDATARALASPGGMTFEADLSLLHMPRVAQAPLQTLGVAIHTSRPEPPKAVGEGEEPPVRAIDWLAIEPPVGFEPDAAIRAFAFGNMFFFSGGFAFYQPGQGNSLEVVGYLRPMDGYSVGVAAHPLYEPLTTLGSVEIGKMWNGGAVVRREDGTIEPVEVSGDTVDVVKRGKSLHVIAVYDSTETDGWTQTTRFSACAVHADGSMEPIMVEPAPYDPPFDASSTSTSHDKDYTTFSVEGRTKSWDGSPAKKLRHTWKWNAKENAYLLK